MILTEAETREKKLAGGSHRFYVTFYSQDPGKPLDTWREGEHLFRFTLRGLNSSRWLSGGRARGQGRRLYAVPHARGGVA